MPSRATRDIKQLILNPKRNEGKLGTYNFDPLDSRKKLAQMIILHEHPLSMVEHEGFRDSVNSF